MGQAKQKIKTSRELAETVGDLIENKIVIHMLFYCASDAAEKTRKVLVQRQELLIRELADGFKRLDHNKGVYKG